jgi:hypothetical protein
MSLGESYVGKFKVGDYVTWRTLSVKEDKYYDEYHGIIIDLIYYEDEVRPVHYARILENKSADTFYVVLSCLTKIETN